MDPRLEQLIGRLAELEAEAARQVRDFSLAELQGIARSAAETGEVSDEDLLEALLVRLEAALGAAYAVMLLDVTQRIGVNLTTESIRAATESVLRRAAADLVPSARLAIADTVATAFKRGWSVDRTARRIRKFITLAPSQVSRMETLAAEMRLDSVGAARKVGLNAPANATRGQINRVVERFRVRLERERALAVARQEIWRTGQFVEHEAWVQAVEQGIFRRGEVTKHWNDQGDSHVRSSHRTIAEIYPQGLGLDEAFVTSRGLLMYPLDPNGSADNVIGCRCWLTYKVRGEVR